MKFNYYPSNIKSVKPLGLVSLEKFITAIKNPKADMIDILEKIEFYSKIKDEKNRAKYKQMLYFFTPAVVCSYRNYKNIETFTGLAPLDFDKLPSQQYAEDLKHHLFKEHDYIIATWLSSSKLGVRALVSIPICNNIDEYKLRYNAIIHKFGIYDGFDTAPKNCVLPLFYSHDRNILSRDNYTTFTDKYEPPKPKPKGEIIRIYKDKKVELVAKMVKSGISKIHDYGHPPLRALAYAVGGYVASDYVNFDEAYKILCDEIDANSYLSQKATVYKATAKQMLTKGMSEPLEIRQ